MKRVRGGRGLGDALYLRPIVDHLLNRCQSVTVCCDYPDVFRGADCTVEPFNRDADVLAHYVNGKSNAATTQWDDICDSAQVGRIALKFTWNVANHKLVNEVRERAMGRRVVLIHGGRPPFGRDDGFGIEMMPEKKAFDQVQQAILRETLFVRIGEGPQKYAMDHAEIDLWKKTSVADLLDLAWDCDAIIGPCSFVIPLAEAFDKPLLTIWGASGMHHARHPYVKSITPQKILSKPTSRFVIDDYSADEIKSATQAWFEMVKSRNAATAGDARFIEFAEVRKFFNGKTVAIIGSAPSCLDNGVGFIDSHDIVVRINNHKCGPAQGLRTDVHYSFYGTSIRKTREALQQEGVKLCLCKCPDGKPLESAWHERNGKTPGIDFRYIYLNRAGFWFCDTFIPSAEMFMEKFNLLGGHIPTTGFSAILDVLACEPRSVFLTGFDFFTSGLHNVDEKWREGDPDDPIRHRPEREALWLAENQGRYPLTFDARLTEIIAGKRAALAA